MVATLQGFKIAIIGGGPAGLTLAALLSKNDIDFTLFELRSKPSDAEAEEPAGTLDLHEDSGLLAIKAAGLYDEFLTYTDDCTQEMIIVNKAGEVIAHDHGHDEDRPEISRNKLRKLLLSPIPPASIRWDHKLTSVGQKQLDGRLLTELDFGLNGTHRFDLVVGADGAWSKTRAFLTDLKPEYSGYHNITLHLRDVESGKPELAKMIGKGTYMALEDHHGVCAQRATQDSARIYIFVSAKDKNFGTQTGLESMTAAEARRYLEGPSSMIADWSNDIKDLVASACEDEAAKAPDQKLNIVPLYRLPIGHRWKHRPGVTIIGDASHLLNPGAGDGANMGMKDAMDICNAITSAMKESEHISSRIDNAIEAAENAMAARIQKSAQDTMWVNKLMFEDQHGAEALSAAFKAGEFGAPEISDTVQ